MVDFNATHSTLCPLKKVTKLVFWKNRLNKA